MDQITVHLAQGFEEIEAITIIDVLRRAGLQVITVSVTGKLEVTGSHQIEIKADQLFENIDYEKISMIILPGGMPGARNLDEHQGLKSRLIEFHLQGKWLGAICAAPMVLGKLGILKGKGAVCYPGFESYLADAALKIVPYLTDSKVITGRGVGAALEFSLEIVKLLVGEERALQLRKALLVS